MRETRISKSQQNPGSPTSSPAPSTSRQSNNNSNQPQNNSPTRRSTRLSYQATQESSTNGKSDPSEPIEDGVPLVDMNTFGQLLEMDDDEAHSFSKSLTWDYFDQAVTTFAEMDAAVEGGDLINLSRKGHFLKGSSAALGLNKVKASCEKMQHYGNKKKANGEGTLTETEAMDRCKALLEQLKDEQKLSKAWLERFYAERNA